MKNTKKFIFAGVLVALASIIVSCASSLHIKEFDWNNKEVSKCEDVLDDEEVVKQDVCDITE